MKKKKKLYYVPGLISLFILPILLLIQNKHEIKETRQNAIDYYITPIKKEHYEYEIPAKRDYIEVRIEGDTKNDSLHFIFIKNFAKALDQSRDTTFGLKIVFGNKIKYRDFICTLNSLLKAKCQTYIPIEDTLFVYYMNRTDGCPECNIPNDWVFSDWFGFVDDNRTSQEKLRDHRQKLKNRFLFHMHYWPIFLVYILLAILATIKIIKEFKEQKK